jgi:hypothetical protein
MLLALQGVAELRALDGIGKACVVSEGRPLLRDER